jgi:hypothetical protein
VHFACVCLSQQTIAECLLCLDYTFPKSIDHAIFISASPDINRHPLVLQKQYHYYGKELFRCVELVIAAKVSHLLVGKKHIL